VLRGIESTIADMETAITAAMMPVVQDPAIIQGTIPVTQ